MNSNIGASEVIVLAYAAAARSAMLRLAENFGSQIVAEGAAF
jgi:hypothetical protein